jgi:hypothetical protein
VVELLVGVDDPRQAADAESAYVLDDLSGGCGGGVRVDHDEPCRAADERHVDVPPLVAGEPDAVRDLLEAGVGHRSSVGARSVARPTILDRPCRIGTPIG